MADKNIFDRGNPYKALQELASSHAPNRIREAFASLDANDPAKNIATSASAKPAIPYVSEIPNNATDFKNTFASVTPEATLPPSMTYDLPKGSKRGNIPSVNSILDMPEKDFHHGLHKLAHDSNFPVNRFKKSIAAYESGKAQIGYGNYDAIGPVVNAGSFRGEHARGAYQVMPGNLKKWGDQSADYLERKGYDKEITNSLRNLNVKKYENPRTQELLVTSRFEGLREGAPEFFGKDQKPHPQSFDQMAGDWFGHGKNDGYTDAGVYHGHVMHAFAVQGGEKGGPEQTRLASNGAVPRNDMPPRDEAPKHERQNSRRHPGGSPRNMQIAANHSKPNFFMRNALAQNAPVEPTHTGQGHHANRASLRMEGHKPHAEPKHGQHQHQHHQHGGRAVADKGSTVKKPTAPMRSSLYTNTFG